MDDVVDTHSLRLSDPAEDRATIDGQETVRL
jgi:hypothetical protein